MAWPVVAMLLMAMIAIAAVVMRIDMVVLSPEGSGQNAKTNTMKLLSTVLAQVPMRKQ
jgi:hypothetical protein